MRLRGRHMYTVAWVAMHTVQFGWRGVHQDLLCFGASEASLTGTNTKQSGVGPALVVMNTSAPQKQSCV